MTSVFYRKRESEKGFLIERGKMEKREKFTSKLGFVTACIGSAIGLGNIWMFPYRLGRYGGAAFLIPYLIFVIILGSTGLITEFSFGRKYAGGSMTGIVTIFKEKHRRFGRFVGMLPAVGLAGIFMFYNIVVGWILKYFGMSITGKLKTVDKDTFFNSFAGTGASVPWDILAVVITVLIICAGVINGIERISKIIMPALFVIFAALAVRSVTLPGAAEGVKFLLMPKWEYLLKADTWIMALGQAFFTVSVNGCGMVVYGSYLKKEYDIPKLALSTAVLDTLAALLASFVIMPAVFAFGVDLKAGPPLLFMTMPVIFDQMPGGRVIAVIFFLSLLFAAVSSSINMLEGVVEAVISNTRLTRKRAVFLVGAVLCVLSVPLNLSMSAFDSFTNMITIVVSPLAALLVVFVFYYMGDAKEALREMNLGASVKMKRPFLILAKYSFTAVTILVVILGVVYGGIG